MLASYIMFNGTVKEHGQAFLVVDKNIVNQVNSFGDIPFVLLAVYFIFNIKYPVGCINFFSFLKFCYSNFL